MTFKIIFELRDFIFPLSLYCSNKNSQLAIRIVGSVRSEVKRIIGIIVSTLSFSPCFHFVGLEFGRKNKPETKLIKHHQSFQIRKRTKFREFASSVAILQWSFLTQCLRSFVFRVHLMYKCQWCSYIFLWKIALKCYELFQPRLIRICFTFGYVRYSTFIVNVLFLLYRTQNQQCC